MVVARSEQGSCVGTMVVGGAEGEEEMKEETREMRKKRGLIAI